MYWFTERCTSIAIAIFSTLIIMGSISSIYMAIRIKESEIWEMQEEPKIKNSYLSLNERPENVETVK